MPQKEIKLSEKKICNRKFSAHKGCEYSDDARLIYTERDAANTAVVKFGFGYLFVGNVIPHAFPTMCPLLYWLFGTPKPDSWFLSLMTDKV